jgi:hypothetical protein
MAITSQFYPNAGAAIFNNQIDSGDTFKLMLLANAYNYSNVHTVVGDVEEHEISGPGYTAGGAAITITAGLKEGPEPGDRDRTELTLGNVLFSSATFTFKKAVIYSVDSGALLMYLDFGSVQDVAGQNYQLNAPAPKPTLTPVPL